MTDAKFIVDVTRENFAKVMETSRTIPVLMDFWADWCQPCKVLMPVLAKLAEEYQGRFLLAKLNTEESQDIAAHFGIRSIPTVKLFRDGRVVDEFMGALPASDVRAFLDRHIARESDAEIDEALGRVKEVAARHNPMEMRESASPEQSAAIWKGRKAAFGATGQVADYLCMDGTVPLSALPKVLVGTAELAKAAGLGVANVFHAGDGNMHPLILFNANDPAELAKAEKLGGDILLLCVEAGGCLTGEHGVGVEKRDLMDRQYGPEDLDAQMSVKDVFDPHWLLNPAKVFPIYASASRREGGRPEAA